MKEQIHVIDKRKVSNKELKQILLENKNIKFEYSDCKNHEKCFIINRSM